MVGAEDGEKCVASDDTKKNTERTKNIKEDPENIVYLHPFLDVPK